ncbi:putative polysaccharide export protein [Thiomonas arsenitoxydans]|uniref:Polysaccharide export protein n=1 Tax=Thiomonas arsenitoxydans (strain DSM 22701 / CIP 110005 / 3As) TaxID=426114 RepID=D6CP67_THIA3|nr:SLBB domain-containing protein [Thiomonas arsenitoxydans]CAZ90345.1 putative polysaccharide export protein [Thiomonas arsenitoxydans]CQR28146.1 putative polysaccharide export protein [Thiomonas arsenitoxydans]CQR28147.1 putative polysaccharide export protein [Thiomonas arsenitoxydans]CQR28704.1 putative polysaccharide export protein [Thiomonas arsenitoxydans]CQR31186.1 putative polysaccharide export protein [Thiomonas arsenitoxydans]
MRFRPLFALFIALIVLLAARAQAGEYLLGPGDIVSVTVYGHPELQVPAVQVDAQGQVVLPLLGYVPVGGLSATAASKAVAARLKEGGFILKPYVNLLVDKYFSQQAVVLGAVNKPGKFVLDSGSRVTDLLAQAGGIGPTGADSVILQRSQDGKRTDTTIRLDALFAGGSAPDPVVSAGDVLYVPQAPVFYIEGEVNKPGAYRLAPGMTLLQAVALGGGLTRRGTLSGASIHRAGEGDKTAVQRGAGADTPIRADDVIDIGQSLF